MEFWNNVRHFLSQDISDVTYLFNMLRGVILKNRAASHRNFFFDRADSL